MTTNIFEKASRVKLRFETTVGALSVEQLWDLQLKSGKVSLDALAVGLHEKLEKQPRTSFVDSTTTTPEANLDKLRFDILLHIIKVRQEQIETNTKRAAATSQREYLSKLIEEKKQEDLKGKSLEELQAMLDKAGQ